MPAPWPPCPSWMCATWPSTPRTPRIDVLPLNPSSLRHKSLSRVLPSQAATAAPRPRHHPAHPPPSSRAINRAVTPSSRRHGAPPSRDAGLRQHLVELLPRRHRSPRRPAVFDPDRDAVPVPRRHAVLAPEPRHRRAAATPSGSSVPSPGDLEAPAPTSSRRDAELPAALRHCLSSSLLVHQSCRAAPSPVPEPPRQRRARAPSPLRIVLTLPRSPSRQRHRLGLHHRAHPPPRLTPSLCSTTPCSDPAAATPPGAPSNHSTTATPGRHDGHRVSADHGDRDPEHDVEPRRVHVLAMLRSLRRAPVHVFAKPNHR